MVAGECKLNGKWWGGQRDRSNVYPKQKNSQRNHCTDIIRECQKGLEANRRGFGCYLSKTPRPFQVWKIEKKELDPAKRCWFVLSALSPLQTQHQTPLL